MRRMLVFGCAFGLTAAACGSQTFKATDGGGVAPGDAAAGDAAAGEAGTSRAACDSTSTYAADFETTGSYGSWGTSGPSHATMKVEGGVLSLETSAPTAVGTDAVVAEARSCASEVTCSFDVTFIQVGDSGRLTFFEYVEDVAGVAEYARRRIRLMATQTGVIGIESGSTAGKDVVTAQQVNSQSGSVLAPTHVQLHLVLGTSIDVAMSGGVTFQWSQPLKLFAAGRDASHTVSVGIYDVSDGSLIAWKLTLDNVTCAIR